MPLHWTEENIWIDTNCFSWCLGYLKNYNLVLVFRALWTAMNSHCLVMVRHIHLLLWTDCLSLSLTWLISHNEHTHFSSEQWSSTQFNTNTPVQTLKHHRFHRTMGTQRTMHQSNWSKSNDHAFSQLNLNEYQSCFI